MDCLKENDDKVIKKKKRNIFQRLSYSVSKYFHKPKISNQFKNGNCNSPEQGPDDIAFTSKSQDNLNLNDKSTVKRKPFKGFLNIPKRNDRCLSEGDLTREEGGFYSAGSSPKAGPSGTYQSNISESSRTDSNFETDSKPKPTHIFKNELALRLKGKSSQPDNDSEHSKTPESPTGIDIGTSPSRNLFNDTRTPRSMSSLSHSSNSLLSGNTANIYGTSDGESMSRSVIDSHDDIGIVVDLATPICKTTTATLLDSTAARQKIAASKARRVRPKAIANAHSDNVPHDDSGRFSPAREKRGDILEEISEEDCVSSSNVPAISEEEVIATKSDIKPESDDTATKPSSHAPTLSDRIDVIDSGSDVKITSSSQPNETEDSPLHLTSTTSSQPNETGDSTLYLTSTTSSQPNETGDSPLHLTSTSSSQPNETGDSPIDSTPASSSNSTPLSTVPDDSKPRGYNNLYKTKFHFENDKSKPEKVETKFLVKLRPTGINNFNNTGDHSKEHTTDHVFSPEHSNKIVVSHKTEENASDSVKVHHYSPHRPSKDIKNNSLSPPITYDSISETENTTTSHVAHNATGASNITDNRKSRVLSMLKNFES